MPLSTSRFRTASGAGTTGGPTHRWASVRDLARPSRYRSSGEVNEERSAEATERADRTVVIVAFEPVAGGREALRRDVDDALSGCGLAVVAQDHSGGLLLLVRARPVRVLRDLLPALIDMFRGREHREPVVVALDGGSVEHAVAIATLPAHRRLLADAPRGRVVVAVSDEVYEAVVAPGYAGGNPSTYAPVPLADGRRAWIRVPGYARPPVGDERAHRHRDGTEGRPEAGMSGGNVFLHSVVNGPVYGRDHIDLRGGDRG